MNRLWSYLSLFTVILCQMVGCAVVGPPGGGPEDETPPWIVSVNPPDGALNVKGETPVIVEFNEDIDPVSIPEALFINPEPPQPPRLRVRGKTAAILWSEPISQNVTVVITLGSSIRDLHGNRMRESFTFAFSTGESINRGTIEGYVYSTESVEGMLVGAWRLEDQIPESLAHPPFATMVGKEGRFQLSYLPAGTFRLFVWDDRDRNKSYRPGVERLGVGWEDPKLGEGETAFMAFIPIKEDTTRQRPLTFHMPDPQHLSVKWRKKWRWDEDSVWVENLLIRWGESVPLGAKGAIIDPGDSARTTFVLPLPPSTVATRESVAVAWKHLGEETIQIKVASTQDTTPIALLWSYPSVGEKELPPDLVGTLIFNDFLAELPPPGTLTLFIADTLPWGIHQEWDGGAQVRWKPAMPLPPERRVTLKVDSRMLRDLNGNSGDSLYMIIFTPYDPADRGAVSGRVEGIESNTRVVITLWKIGGKAQIPLPYALLNPEGSFSLEGIPVGKYRLFAYYDANGDLTYTPGRLNPFRLAEKFAFSEDTLEVKKRWQIGDVVIKF